jgi:hypothetical protein
MAAGIEPLQNLDCQPEPQAVPGPQRASLYRRAMVFAGVCVFAELPLLLFVAALYHKQTFQHPWVHWVMLGLMIPMWLVVGLTVLIGGGFLLCCFIYWIVTGSDPIRPHDER